MRLQRQIRRLGKTIFRCASLYDSFVVQSSFRPFHNAGQLEKGGLFGTGLVREAKDFRSLSKRVYERSGILVNEALSGANRKRKLVAVLDELSDTICQAADMAECLRMLHPHSSFIEEAEECVSELGQLVESLNSNRDLYLTLRRAIETDDIGSSCRTPLDDVDRRVAKLLADDMETSGVHLPESERFQFIEYSSAIFTMGAEFMRAAHECRKVTNLKNVTSREFLDHQKERLQTLLTLRRRLALSVGYESFGERALRGSFLQTPENVNEFLIALVDEIRLRTPSILSPTGPGSVNEKQHSTPMFYDSNVLILTPEKLISEKINRIAEKLVGIRFEMVQPDPEELWHPFVTKLVAYDCKTPSTKTPLGVVYCDWFERERKCGDAHFTIRCGRQLDSSDGNESKDVAYQSPVVVLSFRLTPPSSLLPYKYEQNIDPSDKIFNSSTTTLTMTGAQLETLLHEFGHAFHTLVGRTRYQHVSGTRCSTDIAEIPSTFLEHYVYDEKAATPLWGSVLDNYRQNINIFHVGGLLQQSVMALVDLRLHTSDPEKMTMEQVCERVADDLRLPVVPIEKLLILDHLVTYGSRYHSYLVARSLASLLWRRGDFVGRPLERQKGDRFRRLLQYGGEISSHELMQSALGYVPTTTDLVKSLAQDLTDERKTATNTVVV